MANSGSSSLVSFRVDIGAEYLRDSVTPFTWHLSPQSAGCPLVGRPHLVQLWGRVPVVRAEGRELAADREGSRELAAGVEGLSGQGAGREEAKALAAGR